MLSDCESSSATELGQICEGFFPLYFFSSFIAVINKVKGGLCSDTIRYAACLVSLILFLNNVLVFPLIVTKVHKAFVRHYLPLFAREKII